MFDENFWQYLDRTVDQLGDAFSISDITRIYVKAGLAEVLSVGTETWVDCGTPEALLQASQMAKDGKLDPTPHR
jgi:dTDP-glucose pyrophosphorylase